MDIIKQGDTWRLPSRREVVVQKSGLWDIELRYADTTLGECFYVQRVWLVKFGTKLEKDHEQGQA